MAGGSAYSVLSFLLQASEFWSVTMVLPVHDLVADPVKAALVSDVRAPEE